MQEALHCALVQVGFVCGQLQHVHVHVHVHVHELRRVAIDSTVSWMRPAVLCLSAQSLSFQGHFKCPQCGPEAFLNFNLLQGLVPLHDVTTESIEADLRLRCQGSVCTSAVPPPLKHLTCPRQNSGVHPCNIV
jgi:hypothetical protein